MEPLSESEMRRVTRSLQTKADKIRALGRAGATPADIGRFLGIRYQHAYNVLKRSGIVFGRDAVRDAARNAEGVDASVPAKAVLDETGHLLLPDRILAQWSATPGEELLVRVEGDELRVLTRRAGLQLAKDILRKYPKAGKGMAHELIAERRREAEQDDR